MDIIRFTINNPVKVAVGVLLVCLFGMLALFQIPIQLTPNVDEPKVTVTTRWTGKSAREVEREIIDRQEEKLKAVTGLRKMTSEAVEGRATVTLEFFVGTDKDAALRETDEKINQVTGYPPEVEEPEIEASDAAMASPIAWMILYSENEEVDVSTLRDFVWDEVKPILERVDGLAAVDVYGGREREVHVLIDPARLASRKIALREVETALRDENVNVSAGTVPKGKREFIYRTAGEYEDPEQILNTVIAYQQGGPVYVRDVARVKLTHEKVRSFVRSKGRRVLAIPARRETGSNVIQVMEGLKEKIAQVNKELLQPRGLKLEQLYDETVYIDSAINLVRNNLFMGGALATIVLILFLRSIRATGVVALSIPISVIATFLMVSLLGRNINVVMLAGMAFAVGMVVDNAVVVLENIYRHKQMGKTAFQAAYDGGSEVWGAILASTLTTMAVFLPVIFIQEEAGQLFRDIAIAISAGVAMSLLVAVLVIPTVSARVLGHAKLHVSEEETDPHKPKTGFAASIARGIGHINRWLPVKIVIIVTFVLGSVLGSWWLMPPTDYLPSGNRNLVFGFLQTEPGLGTKAFKRISLELEDYLKPYWSVKAGTPEAEKLPKVKMLMPGATNPGKQPPMVEVQPAPIQNFFYVNFQNQAFIGVTSQDDENVKPLQAVMTQAIQSAPNAVGIQPFFFQVPLFGGARSGAGNSVDLEIRGNNLREVNESAAKIWFKSMEKFGFVNPSPPNFDLPRPEIRAIPDRVRAADVGLNVRDVGFTVAAAVDGAYVGGYRQKGDEIDLLVKLENSDNSPIKDVHQVPVYTPSGNVVPLSSIVNFKEVPAPQQINHIEEMPAVSLSIQGPPGQPLQALMDNILNEVIQPLRKQGQISDDIYVNLAGNADKLQQTRNAMFGNWTGFNLSSLLALVQSRGFLALVVIYLLMAALFESFIHPLAILFTVPLAMVGGFLGLKLVYLLSLRNPVTPIQTMDVVTMLGFVILLGIVVNNAILIVHQTLNNLRAGMKTDMALQESVRTRIRPIFMTAFTTIGGQIPLALMTGAGSELYRGLASVMVGGLFCSTLFTIILVPVVFSMFLNTRRQIMRRLGRDTDRERVFKPAHEEEPASLPADESLEYVTKD